MTAVKAQQPLCSNGDRYETKAGRFACKQPLTLQEDDEATKSDIRAAGFHRLPVRRISFGGCATRFTFHELIRQRGSALAKVLCEAV